MVRNTILHRGRARGPKLWKLPAVLQTYAENIPKQTSGSLISLFIPGPSTRADKLMTRSDKLLVRMNVLVAILEKAGRYVDDFDSEH